MKQVLMIIFLLAGTACYAQHYPGGIPAGSLFNKIQIGPEPGDTLSRAQLRNLLAWIEENDWQPGYKVYNKNGSGMLIDKDTMNLFIGPDVKVIRYRNVNYKIINGILKKI